ncbi:hypothetical protein BJX76DRAFT_279890 [Aspergillus varians]
MKLTPMIPTVQVPAWETRGSRSTGLMPIAWLSWFIVSFQDCGLRSLVCSQPPGSLKNYSVHIDDQCFGQTTELCPTIMAIITLTVKTQGQTARLSPRSDGWIGLCPLSILASMLRSTFHHPLGSDDLNRAILSGIRILPEYSGGILTVYYYWHSVIELRSAQWLPLLNVWWPGQESSNSGQISLMRVGLDC